MPCFFARQIIGCKNLAEYRVEGAHVIMHVCGDHLEEAKEISPPSKVTELAPQPGGVDVLNMKSLDNEDLKRDPHIISADDEILSDRSS